MSNSEYFLMAWAIGATVAFGWMSHMAKQDMDESIKHLQLANDTLRKWKRMIDATLDGKGRFVRIGGDELRFEEIKDAE